jgi:hypothetical protein
MEKHLGLTTYLKVEYRFFLWSLVLTDLFFYFINLNNFLVGQNWSHQGTAYHKRFPSYLWAKSYAKFSTLFHFCKLYKCSPLMSTILSRLWLFFCLSFGYAVMRRKIPDGTSHKFLFLYFSYYFFFKFKKQVFLQVYRYLQVDRWRGVLPFSVSIIAYLISM